MSSSGRLVVLTGTSGVGLGAADDRLRPLLSGTWTHVKFEDYLNQGLVKVDPSAAKPELLMHLMDRPLTVLRRVWSESLRLVSADIRTALSHGDVLLRMHASWYSEQKELILNCVNYRQLFALIAPVDKVINLVDDIYDTFCRLATRDAIWSDPRSSFVYQVRKLGKLLQWREAEFATSQAIASALGIPDKLYLVAVKHPVMTLARLIQADSPETLYLSHPITDVRLSQDWEGPVVKQVEDVAESLRADYVVFEPTTIDEKRLTSVEGFNGSRLTPRWPIPPSRSLVTDAADGVDKLLSSERTERDGKGKREDSVLIEGLMTQIDAQVNWRDRQLVEQSKYLVAIRPFAKPSGVISGGMDEEIKLHRSLVVWATGSSVQKPEVGRAKGLVWHPAVDEERRRMRATKSVLANYLYSGRGKRIDSSLLSESIVCQVRDLALAMVDISSPNYLSLGQAAIECVAGGLPVRTIVGVAQEYEEKTNLQHHPEMGHRHLGQSVLGERLCAAIQGFPEPYPSENEDFGSYSTAQFAGTLEFVTITSDMSSKQLVERLRNELARLVSRE